MTLPLLAIVAGIAITVWSAGLFIDGAAAIASIARVSPLLIGMLIVGFGTSAPELVVSVMASWQGTPGLALGNAYGSNIANIALILGLTAIISPIAVNSRVLRRELPLLCLFSVGSVLLIMDLFLSRLDGLLHLLSFSALMIWSIFQGKRKEEDVLATETIESIDSKGVSPFQAVLLLISGLLLLVAGSRLLVWGAVLTARHAGISDQIIGLTIVAIGTSLPELASSIAAVRKNEDDIALGNVVGSNLFNTLCVVGIAASVKPFAIEDTLFRRDAAVMLLLTVLLFILCFGLRGRKSAITRIDGALMFSCYVIYLAEIILSIKL